MRHPGKNYTEAMGNAVTTDYSEVINVLKAKTLSIQAIIDVNTPAAKTFTAAVTDICTSAANDYTTGLKVQLTTTTTLPAGLSLATDYFVVVLTTTTFKLATSLANATAATPIVVDITDAGTGTHTITPVALAAATISLQKSNDNLTFDDVTTATAVTVDADVWFEKVDPEYGWARVKVTMTAGRIATSLNVLVKE